MHKKLEAELVSLAHSILQMKNNSEVLALKEKARLLYEKLSVLTFVDNYVTSTPNFEQPNEKLIKEKEPDLDKREVVKPVAEKIKTIPKPTVNPVQQQQKKKNDENIFEPTFDKVKIDIGSLKPNQISIKEEFRDSISADKTSTLFDEDDKYDEKKTLNDRQFTSTIQIGLNDRIAFVKHLFNFSQADFNRILSQLNTLKSEKEAKNYIYNQVKPDYDWTGKEEYEERLITIIERKFT